jgi:alginate O-acetyltransferase complex protein AlgI
MVFSSTTFFVFFAVFFFLYWFIFNKNFKSQNLLLLVGSYVFSAWADWRLNFFLGIYIEKQVKRKRLLLFVGLAQGIGGLIFFKYFDFFIPAFNEIFKLLHLNINLFFINIIVPLGISFFTFRTVSYILDVNKGKMYAAKNWLVFFNYVSFFPSILAGPIDKAKLLIPQLEKKREFEYHKAVDALRQILWGLFKKIVIADSCLVFTNEIFDNFQTLPSSSLLLGAFLYAIQVYADFSGYSDMAVGFARLIGFNITKNFDFPFFAKNIPEFWRKWHISLTSWLTEYVFTPLSIAFRDLGKVGLILAILINLTIVGLWHGSKSNYILYGFIHGLYFIPFIINETMNKRKKEKEIVPVRQVMNSLFTFIVVMFTFVIFRSKSIGDAFQFYKNLFSTTLFSIPDYDVLVLFIFIGTMFLIEWNNREREHGFQVGNYKPGLRWGLYYAIACSIVFYYLAIDVQQQFLYFQF